MASFTDRELRDLGLTGADIERELDAPPRLRPPGEPAGEFSLGWPVVLACFAVAIFAWGFAAFGPSVYLAELQRAHGWSAAAIGTATSMSFLLGALLLPWVGAAIERCGGRAVLTAGIVLIGVGVLGIGRVTALWQLYACNLLIGCGWAGASSTAISTILAQHFDRRRGLALSLALAGASAGGFGVAPALVSLGHWHGFRTAVAELVLGLALAILPVVWAGIRSRGAAPRRHGAAASASALPELSSRAAALRDARFWSVAGPFALAIAAQVGMMVVQVSICCRCSVPPAPRPRWFAPAWPAPPAGCCSAPSSTGSINGGSPPRPSPSRRCR